jgi:hypothetical protein
MIECEQPSRMRAICGLDCSSRSAFFNKLAWQSEKRLLGHRQFVRNEN